MSVNVGGMRRLPHRNMSRLGKAFAGVIVVALHWGWGDRLLS